MAGQGGEQAVLSGTLHLWANGALFIGADMANEPHRHFTTSVLLGLEGPFRLRVGKDEWMPVDGAMVAPNVEQQLDARGVKLAILQVDPESDAYARMAHRFGGDGLSVLSPGTVARLRAIFRKLDGKEGSMLEAWERTLAELSGTEPPRRAIDPRIRRVLGIIKSDFLSPPPAAKLAAQVGLSAGRLIHLFTREMGLPIRRYILWLRLRDVIISLIAGSTLTEAAHHAGFSDSAHLSRTFRGMFGFAPSAISESRGKVRLAIDPAAARMTDAPHPPIDAERLARAAPRSGA